MTINNPYQQQVPPQMGQPGMMTPPPMPMHLPISRRQRLGRRLMAGLTVKMTSLPYWFASYAVGAYMVALLGVSVLFSNHAMEWYFGLFGVVWVTGFFFLSVRFSSIWSILKIRKRKSFEKRLFWTGFFINVFYAIFIYYFYIYMTGKPYEFAPADSDGYVETATDFVNILNEGRLWSFIVEYAKTAFSDMGYPLVIMWPIYLFDIDLALLVIRIIQAVFGTYTSLILYRIASRSLGETTGRIAAIFCLLHPVLICYVGITLKETIMTWLLVFFIDSADRMLVGRKYTFSSVAPMALAGLGLFMFRTVLGLVAILAVFFALVMMDSRLVSYGKKIILGVVLILLVMLGASENIMREVDKIRNTDIQGQQQISMTKRYGSEKGGEQIGNKFADYAGAAVFAPLIFTIPLPTMVATAGQEDIRLIQGGNWMRNVMSGFVIMAMFMLLLTGDWRKYTLPLAMLLGYLLMLVFTEFAHSLRFHIPVMPIEMMFAAYAITNMRKKHRNWYLIWCILCIVMCFAWNWFKLAGRDLV